MRSEVSYPTHQCPQSLRKRDLREKPRNLLESDEQCPGALGGRKILRNASQ